MLALITKTAVVRLFGAATSITLLLFLSNVHGAEVVGIYQYTIVFLTGVALLSNFGFYQVAMRELASVPAAALSTQTGNFLFITLVVAVVSISLIYLACTLYIHIVGGHKVLSQLLIYVFVAVPMALHMVCMSCLKARLRILTAAFFESVICPWLLLPLLLGVTLIGINIDATVVALMMCAVWLSAMIAGLLSLRPLSINIPTLGADGRRLCRAGAPCFIIDILGYLQNSIGILALATLADAQHVGLFSVSHNLTMIFPFIHSTLVSIYAPRIAAAHTDGNPKNTARIVHSAANYMYLIMLPAAGLLYLLTSPLLAIFGEEFIAAASLVHILLIGQIINILCGPADAALIMADRATASQRSVFVGVIVASVCAFQFIPDHGAIGAAVTMSTTLASMRILSLLQAKYYLGFWTFAGRMH